MDSILDFSIEAQTLVEASMEKMNRSQRFAYVNKCYIVRKNLPFHADTTLPFV